MKSRFTTILGSMLLLFLIGCNKPFQPVPPLFLLWSKNGENAEDIKKALLECGFPDPYNGVDREIINGVLITHSSIEESAQAELCMEKNAYIQKTRRFCDSISNIRSCESKNQDAIPKRDINRRLNSKFCKMQENSSICKP